MSVAACVDGSFGYSIVDGNLEQNPWKKIEDLLNSGKYGFFVCTVMPGIQIRQAIPFSKKIKDLFPEIIIIWGGYFPSAHPEIIIQSSFVDFVVIGPAAETFPLLMNALRQNTSADFIPNLAFFSNNKVLFTGRKNPDESNLFPVLPYNKLNEFYPIKRYLAKTFLGNQTIGYHSSFGCPFKCSFCAVPGLFYGSWIQLSADRIVSDLLYIRKNFGGDAIEFNDNNFFVSEQRTVDFCNKISSHGFSWWAEGRIDTLSKYQDSTLKLMRASGCKMIFMGAESGTDSVLQAMNKCGTQNGNQILFLASRLKQFDIIPEYSFVFGLPAITYAKQQLRIKSEIKFIRKLKKINPSTEIILYIYSPVPGNGNSLTSDVNKSGFNFPVVLEKWLDAEWLDFDLRRNPKTPWLNARIIRKINHFEAVLQANYPSVSALNITKFKRKILAFFSFWRYLSGFYAFPYEIKILLRLMNYRSPEKEGF